MAMRHTYTMSHGLLEHMRATGETAPAGSYMQPACMVTHGGYGVRKGGRMIAGPFAWVENARRAADRLGGVMVRWGVPDPEAARRMLQADEAERQRRARAVLHQKRYLARKARIHAHQARSADEVRTRLRAIAIRPDELERALGKAS
jgi:hypothetical protein